MAAAARVSIPAEAQRMVQDVKEAAGGHADEEVYAVLRECDMDPNEAAQRLLSRGTFHEVKRKRDKKKESRKESSDPQWRPGTQDRYIKGGQGNYSSRQLSNSSELSGSKVLAGKENGLNQNMDKGSSRFVNRNTVTKTSTSSSSLPGGLSNGPSQPASSMEKSSLAIGRLRTSDKKRSADLEDTGNVVVTSTPGISQSIQPSPSVSRLRISALDPVPSPSLEACSHSETCSAKHDLGSQQAVGDPEVVTDEGWKPMSTGKSTQVENVTCEYVPITEETVPQSVPVSYSVHKEDLLLEADKRLSEMQLSDKKHVIIPHHIQVIESEKYGLSFGSFGTTFEQTIPKGPECERSATLPLDDSSEELYGVGEPAISCQVASSSIHMEADQGAQQLSVDDSSPQRVDNSSNIPEVAASDLAKDSSAASHVHQDSVTQTTTSCPTFALAPQIHGNQNLLLEMSESQVHQTSDFSANYHTQIYQPIADVDGRLSPFAASGAAPHVQTSEAQELPQGINSFVMPSLGSAPLAAPASGVVPSSIAIPQPPIPLFHQPVGVHLPHYAPSFIPYNHYISPLYYPAHTLNRFMGNAAVFPQPPSTGSMYSHVSAAVAPSVKYSASTYKPDDNTGSQPHVGIPGAYAIYGSSPFVYTNNVMVANRPSVETDDVIGSKFKENSVYVAGQQGDGSTVWIPAPGQDISVLQPTSFYGLASQGQHMAFAPAQAGHDAFRGMYHPGQTMAGAAVHPLQSSQTISGAVEMVGPPATGYQQAQHAQMNWGSY